MILLLLILYGCSMSEVVEQSPQTKSVDTIYIKKADTIDRRIPIRFDITIEDWKDERID